MKAHYQFLCSLALVLFTSCSPDQPTPARNSVPSSPAPVDTGRLVFELNCNSCHGEDGTAGLAGAADLQTSRIDSLSVFKTITDGKKAMPAFVNKLSPGEIEQVTTYVLTLRK